MLDRLGLYYNAKLDEVKVYEKGTKKAVCYIQGYSKKKAPQVPKDGHMSLEVLIWLATNYKEELQQAI